MMGAAIFMALFPGANFGYGNESSVDCKEEISNYREPKRITHIFLGEIIEVAPRSPRDLGGTRQAVKYQVLEMFLDRHLSHSKIPNVIPGAKFWLSHYGNLEENKFTGELELPSELFHPGAKLIVLMTASKYTEANNVLNIASDNYRDVIKNDPGGRGKITKLIVCLEQLR